VHLVTIVPGDNFAGRCVRSGPPSNFDFDDRIPPESQTSEILTVCEQLARMGPTLGSSRVADAEIFVRAQTTMIELVGGQVAESILHPDVPNLGAQHDFVEARALAGVACAASPAVAALVAYAESEAHALLSDNTDILRDLVEALIERGTLSGDEVDTIIEHRIALRSIAAEHQRRDEWRQKELNAAAFTLLNSNLQQQKSTFASNP